MKSRLQRRPKIIRALVSAMLLILGAAGGAAAFDAQNAFTPWGAVLSAEVSAAHFGARLGDEGFLQAWNLAGRFSLLPFGATRFGRFSGIFDGALEVGLQPVFERLERSEGRRASAGAGDIPSGFGIAIENLSSVVAKGEGGGQNFGGLGLALRYYLLHFRRGRLVPWIGASIAPGGSDLKIGTASNETRLTGSFMALIEGGAGVSYFVTDRSALYAGLQAQHLSNVGFNGPNRNFSLNTPWGVVAGVSWFR